MTIVEMVIRILKDANLSKIYWRGVVHTTFYILSRVKIKVNHTITIYELWFVKVGLLSIILKYREITFMLKEVNRILESFRKHWMQAFS